MAILLSELISGASTLPKSTSPVCSVCHEPIDGHVEEIKRIKGKFTCDDCYFEGLGQAVEEFPIRQLIR